MGGFGEGVEPNLDNRLPGFGESVNINDLVRYIFNIESNPVLRDLINQSQPGPETKGRSTQYISSGGKENATKIFDALNLSNIKTIPTQYGPGKVGVLPDGRKVVIRPGSSKSPNTPTLEVQKGKRATKFRFEE